MVELGLWSSLTRGLRGFCPKRVQDQNCGILEYSYECSPRAVFSLVITMPLLGDI